MKQFNLNSVFSLVIGALLAFGIKKLDENNTELVKVSATSVYVAKRVESLESKISDMVLKSDFNAEISRLNREIETLKKKKTQ